MIRAAEERAFYDRIYAQHLDLPDHALACNRRTLAADLANPERAIYERRRLFETALEKLLAQPVAGLRALDYGCGAGDWGLVLAGEGAEVTFLDLSPVAIELALRRAGASGVAHRVRGVPRDAGELACFADAEFDLIFASAALHHTLKYPDALEELVRVLKPGGRLILAETYGNNPLLNAARRLGWRLHRQPAEAGEEILFSDRELGLLRRHFRDVELTPLNLLAMAKRLFRGRFASPWVRRLLAALEVADRLLLRAFPLLHRHCGEVVVVAVR